MEYRPRPRPCYGPNGGYGNGGHGNGAYTGGNGNGGHDNGGYGNGGYGGGHGNGAYTGGHRNGGFGGGHGNGSYGYGGGDGRYLPYGRGAAPGYGVGGGVSQPMAAAMPSTSHGYGQGLGWGASEHLRAVWAPPPPTILPEAMRAAEAAAGEVLLRLHPTEAAERRRQELINYAKRLIGTTFGCEVYAFGSVPLRTYLPDGDVDITILTNTPVDNTFIQDARHLLVSEANNDDAQFVPKKVDIINAKVKIIKCVIDGVVVDISFNQVGGVSTLCFLELVDREIGKEHLFKRSIMLIKAWCYHEQDILGSSQWRLSTYGLEILVLYVFNLFHKSLHGPLEVLYKFLEYYSKFDWDKHCLTLNGPVPMPSRCSFTELADLNDELLLSKEPLKSSLDRLIVLPIGSDRLDGQFCPKHLNIIDPLNGDNNLGNSISGDNMTRIKKAFKHGAQNLGQILKLPSELISDGIYGFFATTLGRHGRGERQDLGDSFSFQSMPDSVNGNGEDVSGLENSHVDENENRSPNSLLELADTESDVKTNMHQSSGLTNFRSHLASSSESANDSIKQCHNGSATNEDVPVARSYIQQNHILTSSTRANTLDVSGFSRVNKSNGTDVSQAKLQLPPFTPPNLLDLSGDLGLPLKCFRNVQYNLEALFDKLLESVKKASLAGVLDENCFRSPTLRFLSDTDARSPRQSVALSTDTDRRNLSPVYCSQGTGDVPRQSITGVQGDAHYQPLSVLHTVSSGLSLYPPSPANSEACHHPWFHNTEDSPQTYGADMYMPNMNHSLAPRMDTVPSGLTFYPAVSVNKENYPFSSPYMAGDICKTRGTGTYIPKIPREICRDRSSYDETQKQMQPDQVYVDNKPDRVNTCNGHAAVESTTGELPLTIPTNLKQNACSSKNFNPKEGSVSLKEGALPNGEMKQVPTSENSEKRCENGSTEMPTLLPPMIVLPQSLTEKQHENIEFGTMGPFSATRHTAKFIEDFPSLAATKKPAASAVKSPKPRASVAKSWPVEAPGSTVQSPKAGVSVTQRRPVEAPASTVQSPRPSESVAQCRPEGFYQLKDDADFPPLQAGARYNADSPPLRAAAR